MIRAERRGLSGSRVTICVSLLCVLGFAGAASCGEYLAPADAPFLDLSITKTVAAATVRVGDTIQFVVRVRNGGPFRATDVFVGDTLPTGLTFVSHSSTQGEFDRGVCVCMA